jgi:hypothetical protein
MRVVVGCTVVERKVKLTWGNGWTRLNNLSTVHSPFQPIGVWNAHAADAKMPFMRTSRGVTLHLCKFNFMAGYEVWAHYGESVRQRTASVTEEEEDRKGDNLRYGWSQISASCDIPPLSKDDQSQTRSLRCAITEVIPHNTSETRILWCVGAEGTLLDAAAPRRAVRAKFCDACKLQLQYYLCNICVVNYWFFVIIYCPKS